jgi:NDP-sugar pyrophosphorylase family protein
MQVVILAGGYGSRLLPFTNYTPKSLMDINGKPFIQLQIELLRKNNINNILVLTGYLGNQVNAFCKRFDIKYQNERNPEGTAKALEKAKCKLEDVFAVMYGDSYLDFNYNDFFNSYKNDALMTIYKDVNGQNNNVDIINDNCIEYIKQPIDRLNYIDFGITILTKEIIDKNRCHHLSTIFSILSARKQLHYYEVMNRYYEIGTFESINKLKTHLKRTNDHS